MTNGIGGVHYESRETVRQDELTAREGDQEESIGESDESAEAPATA